MKILKNNFDEEIYNQIKVDAKKIINVKPYQFLITDNDFFIKSSNLISLKELNPIFFTYRIIEKEQDEKNEFFEIEKGTYYTVGIVSLIELRKYIYNENLNIYYLYFKNEADALTALTILERARHAKWKII